MPLHVVRLSRKPAAAGFQEHARRIRYDAAREIVGRGGADVVLTAHNRDDQAETVLYRLAKYAAPSSLRGMRPREGDLVRPLLCLGAGELRAYCRELGIVYGRDESNETVDYRRNLVRHDVLPVLEVINPRVAETLADAAALADEQHAVIVAALDEAWSGGRARRGRRRRAVVGARCDRARRRASGLAGDVSAPPGSHRPGRRGAPRPPAHAAPGGARRRRGGIAGGRPGRRVRGRARVRSAHGASPGRCARVPAHRPSPRLVGPLLRAALSRRSHRRRRVRGDDRRGLARGRAARAADSCCDTHVAATACARSAWTPTSF